MPSPRLLRAPALLSALLLLAVAPSSRAGDPEPLVYGLNETGSLSINATLLDKLPSGYDPDTGQNSFQKWNQLVVEDDIVNNVANRYALRLDGLLYKNGAKLSSLPFGAVGLTLPAWVGLSGANGSIWAVRQDGVVSKDGVNYVAFPPGNFVYTTCLAVDNNIYALRSDGTVYRNLQTALPFLKFTGPPGINVVQPGVSGSTGNADGMGSETIWWGLAVNPISGDLWGLRRDGVLSTGLSPIGDAAAPGDGEEPVEQIYELPFPTLPFDVNLNDDRYRSLAFPADGVFHVLRGSGQIYTETGGLLEPIVDLPAGGNEPIDDTYMKLATEGDTFWAIRWDGRTYEDVDTSPKLDFTSNRYPALDLALLPPDLSHIKNPKPLAEIYTVSVLNEGAFSVPVYAVDVEKLGSQLSVTLQDPLKKPLPPGLTFNPDPDMDPLTPPTISWDFSTPKGTYSVPIVVSDGVNKPKTYTYKVKVVLPDVNPLKLKSPIWTKVKNLQALVNFDYELEMFAIDPDEGDTVTLSVDTTKEPFLTLGATFTADPGTGTGTFRWSPTFDDIGKHKVKFIATDSTLKEKSYSVTIKVVNSLIFTTPF